MGSRTQQATDNTEPKATAPHLDSTKTCHSSTILTSIHLIRSRKTSPLVQAATSTLLSARTLGPMSRPVRRWDVHCMGWR